MKYKQSLKVLVVEDNLIDRRIVESMLLETSDSTSLLKSSDSLAGTLHLMSQYTFDIVILDLNLSDSHGEETFLKLNRQYPSVAVVINTGAYEDEVGLETLSFGAQDFLVKGKYNAYILNKALHYAVERKRVESELVNAYRKIKEAQDQLVQSEKMKVVGGLASGVAHEVKNPLATLLYGVTYLAQSFSEIDPNVESVIQNMKQAIDKANDIVTDLLNFASLTSLEKKDEHLDFVIGNALSLVRHEFSRNHISVVKKIEKSLPKVMVDKNRIEQVLINLILNAVHAMPDGGDITVRAYGRTLSEDLEDMPQLRRDEFRPGETIVILAVEDDGCGIPEDKIGQIFDPFFTTRRGDGGVGLGLSVSKNIMDIHDGCIFVENKQNGGVKATLIFKVDPVQGGVLNGQEENLNYR
ncbi:MAG: response regulator [Candidatus Omnitrophica bacterium]|nr:response regulator [Candidatus Omnitrophota bacterium]